LLRAQSCQNLSYLSGAIGNGRLDECSASRIGIKISPAMPFNDILDADPAEARPLDALPGNRVLAAARTIEPPTVGNAARLHQDALRALGYLQ